MRVYSEQCDDAAECRGRYTDNVCVCETEFVLVGGYFDLKRINSVVLCTEIKVEV